MVTVFYFCWLEFHHFLCSATGGARSCKPAWRPGQQPQLAAGRCHKPQAQGGHPRRRDGVIRVGELELCLRVGVEFSSSKSRACACAFHVCAQQAFSPNQPVFSSRFMHRASKNKTSNVMAWLHFETLIFVCFCFRLFSQLFPFVCAFYDQPFFPCHLASTNPMKRNCQIFKHQLSSPTQTPTLIPNPNSNSHPQPKLQLSPYCSTVLSAPRQLVGWNCITHMYNSSRVANVFVCPPCRMRAQTRVWSPRAGAHTRKSLTKSAGMTVGAAASPTSPPASPSAAATCGWGAYKSGRLYLVRSAHLLVWPQFHPKALMRVPYLRHHRSGRLASRRGRRIAAFFGISFKHSVMLPKISVAGISFHSKVIPNLRKVTVSAKC